MVQDLSPYVTLIPFLLALLFFMWVSRRLNFGRQLVSALLIACVSFQLLFFLQGYVGIPGDDASEIELILFTVALIFSFNAVTQLLQSLFYEAVIRRRLVKVPNFIINVFGWVATFVIAIIVVRQVLGIELTGLIVTSTIVFAIIALSFQEILSGLFAGLVMQVESPFTIGDWVEVAVVDKPSFVSILTADPAILELLISAVEDRQLETEEQIAVAESQMQDGLSVRANLMNRITRFLGIT